MKQMTRKATRHISQNENLIFEKSSPGKAAFKLPPLDVPDVDTSKLLGSSEPRTLFWGLRSRQSIPTPIPTLPPTRGSTQDRE